MQEVARNALSLFRQGRREEFWNKYCGFLDLDLREFMEIQERLLTEQLRLISPSKLGKQIADRAALRDVKEFRRRMRLTTYEDYDSYLSRQDDELLAVKPVAWAHTSGRSGQYKWAPYTPEAFTKIGEGVLTSVLLSTARSRGEVRIDSGDVFVYNAPSRPYTSGYALRSVAELFDFTFAPPVAETENLSFQERIEVSFVTALRTGIDVIGSISSVLVKLSDRFAKGVGGGRVSGRLLHPRVLARLGRALARSALERRSLLPRDLWRVKGILVGGSDTDIYRERIKRDWGAEPHEQYACTEAPNIMATQAWTRKGMYFLPDVCFYEFIPQQEWNRVHSDKSYVPKTVLLDEVQPGERYGVVITNFYGGPFMRYVLHDLVQFVALGDKEAGIALPSMVFASRDADLIDLASFTGLIDEKLIWKAISNTSIPYVDWTIRKEKLGEHAGLHLYIELKGTEAAGEVAEAVHHEIEILNPFYADLTKFLETTPLKVTVLSPGTFAGYSAERMAAGADLAHLKPAHMNAPNGVLDRLLALSAGTARAG